MRGRLAVPKAAAPAYSSEMLEAALASAAGRMQGHVLLGNYGGWKHEVVSSSNSGLTVRLTPATPFMPWGDNLSRMRGLLREEFQAHGVAIERATHLKPDEQEAQTEEGKHAGLPHVDWRLTYRQLPEGWAPQYPADNTASRATLDAALEAAAKRLAEHERLGRYGGWKAEIVAGGLDGTLVKFTPKTPLMLWGSNSAAMGEEIREAFQAKGLPLAGLVRLTTRPSQGGVKHAEWKLIYRKPEPL